MTEEDEKKVQIENDDLIDDNIVGVMRRFYDSEMKTLCPECGDEVCGSPHIHEPPFNEEFEEMMFCDNCGHEWEETFYLEVKLRHIEEESEY